MGLRQAGRFSRLCRSIVRFGWVRGLSGSRFRVPARLISTSGVVASFDGAGSGGY